MSDLGTEQQNILIWVYKHHSDDTLSPSEGYTKYCQEENYDGKERTFSNLLLKLHDKGMLEKPKRGMYKISQRGKNKADYILHPDKY